MSGFSDYAHSSRDQFRQPPGVLRQATNLATYVGSQVSQKWRAIAPRKYQSRNHSKWSLWRLVSIVNILTAIWVVAVYWGERWAFSTSINGCDWRFWESWPSDATPHHVVLVADPQLVDPHTYPGRPWPLSTLTVQYTDIYLNRVYSLLQQSLFPDTTLFLGDLFDGGREWSTGHSESPEKQWRSYGDGFWLNEYLRFNRLFVKPWLDIGAAGRQSQTGRRKLGLSLPGNHDLGFADGIQRPVRDRFNAFFGDGNRVDIVGNHTFVSVDTVSLSASDHKGHEDIAAQANEFLDNIQPRMRRAVDLELSGKAQHAKFENVVFDAEQLAGAKLPKSSVPEVADLPAVLLTHVPLFRKKGTPCGPLREHWPQGVDATGKPLEEDERNAITIAAGYQYQNVLSPEVSQHIAVKIGSLQYAFSGDDHDYCEVLHRGYPSGGGGIREITVKSLSWAMGVRIPGFVMLSLWNPVNGTGHSLPSAPAVGQTLQSHLCLMPDQLGLFIRYAIMFVATISILLVRAGIVAASPATSAFGGSESPLLPVTKDSPSREKAGEYFVDDGLSNSSSASSHEGLSARNPSARTRSISPSIRGGYGLPAPAVPLIAQAGYYGASRDTYDRSSVPKPQSRARRLKGLGLFYAEFRWSLLRVAVVVLPFYLWLLHNG